MCGIALIPAAGNTAFATSGDETQTPSETEDPSSPSSQDEDVVKPAVIEDGMYTIESVGSSDSFLSVKKESVEADAVAVMADENEVSWSQKWLVVQDVNSGYYTIRNLASRMFLSVSGTAKSGASLKQVETVSSKRQLWDPVKKSGGIQFRSVLAPKLALCAVEGSSSNPKLRLKPTKNVKAQKFKLATTDALEDGRSYFISSVSTPKKGLGVKGNSTENKAKIELQTRSTGKSQKFRLTKVGKAWRMQCVKSCKFASAQGKTLKQVSKASGKARKWRIEVDPYTAAFTICSVAKGTYVSTSAGELALKAQAKANTKAEKAQRFLLTATYGFTVFLDAGHGKNAAGWGVYDPGAPGSGYDEADLTKDLTKRIEEQLEGSDVRVFNGSNYSVPYTQRNTKAKSLGCDVVLSVHFDAGGGTTTSTTVGTHGAAGSSTFNSIIHRKLVSSVGLRDGGTMHRSDLYVVNGKVPAVLMEVCFIDNWSSLNTYLKRRNTVAASLAEGIIEASYEPALQ